MKEDLSQLHPVQRALYQSDIRMQKMEGNITVIANGSGLGLATCDVVKQYEGTVGGLVDLTDNQLYLHIKELLLVLSLDETTKVILVNQYGGVQLVDKTVKIITDIVTRKRLRKPVVFRLKGKSGKQTAELLKKFIDESGTKLLHLEEDFDKACQLAVKLAKENPVKPN